MNKALRIIGIIILGFVIISIGTAVRGTIGNLLSIIGFVGMIFGIIQEVRKRKTS
jgi:uncharacterized Tic20 family protein